MKVVIIGGVATGPKTAARLRRLNPEAEITIIERGKILSYAGCGMPYYVSGDIEDYRSLNSTRQACLVIRSFFEMSKTSGSLTAPWRDRLTG